MKKFLINTATFFALFGVLLVAIDLLTQQVSEKSSNDYLAAIIDKHQRLASHKEPVIIFAGGSNVPYGIDSEQIAKELQVPVVNLGLHAGLGLSFMLEELKHCVKENDTVVLAIEYFLDLEGTHALKERVISFYSEAGKFVKRNYLQDFFARIISVRENTRNNIRGIRMPVDQLQTAQQRQEERNSVYSRRSFNEFGDVIAHLDKDSHTALGSRRIFQYQRWPGIDAVNAFARELKSRNVRVFFMFPSYADSEYKANEKVIGKLAADLAEYLQVSVLGTPSDFVFADTLFFDSIYHLNQTGRKQRTRRIIELLKPALSAAHFPIAESNGTE